MATIERFEDIDSWQKARSLTREIYRVTKRPEFRSDHGYSEQIRRAAVSAMSNIAEGFERDGTKEFIQFLSIAKASVGEVRSLLYVAFDCGMLRNDEFTALYDESMEVGRLIGGFLRYLKKTGVRGSKYKQIHP